MYISVNWFLLSIKLSDYTHYMIFYIYSGFSEESCCEAEVTQVFQRVVLRVTTFLKFSVTWYLFAITLFRHKIQVLGYRTIYWMLLSNAQLLRSGSLKMGCILTQFCPPCKSHDCITDLITHSLWCFHNPGLSQRHSISNLSLGRRG